MLLIERKMQPELRPYIKGLSEVKANIRMEAMESVIALFVPGFKKEQLSLNVEKRTISIEGVLEETSNSGKYLEKEFTVTPFKRVFEISNDYDLNLVTAKLENGILEIRIPRKVNATQTKQISIQ